MIYYWLNSSKIKNDIYIPKYYNPEIEQMLISFGTKFNSLRIGELKQQGIIDYKTGHEIGKDAYGTGNIPFVRTSDISNWEIKVNPKQGIDKSIYDQYVDKQDVKEGDILFVRDGTYLIGVNCFITRVDKELLYQSHILKIRVLRQDILEPEILFLLLNSEIVQRQVRSFQFTADIIDTIGQRFEEIIIPIPTDIEKRRIMVQETRESLELRIRGKAFIKHCPKLIEEVLTQNSLEPIEDFNNMTLDEVSSVLSTDTVTSEFGEFEFTWISSENIIDNILLPKYYDPNLSRELSALNTTCQLITMGELASEGLLVYHTGDEIGKMEYGRGDIPFIRTSDFSNWEIKHDPKQGISEETFMEYTEKQKVKENDIFLVRDGTYLVGSSCLVTSYDAKCLYCGGLYKISVQQSTLLDPYLLLGLLNSYIVKRQIRTKQFTRDVIDTLGHRVDELIIPIPKDPLIRTGISQAIKKVIDLRIQAREKISTLARMVTE